MAYSASKMECLRFAGRKGGEGIGCCAIDIFQGFINDPDAKGAVQLFHGDQGTPLTQYVDGVAKTIWLGPTNKDIFLQYLRIGTFDTQEMPNRMFLASLTDEQVASNNGQKWLAILKEQGFIFIGRVDNSVYTGTSVDISGVTDGGKPAEVDKTGWTFVESDCPCCPGHYEDANGNWVGDDDGEEEGGAHPVHLFGLFRNIGTTRVDDPFKPPKFWEDLPEPTKTHTELWLEGKTILMTEEQATGKAEVAVAKVATPWE